MIIERGSKGETVRSIQEILNFLHFHGRDKEGGDFEPLEVDGVFGPKTEDAVLIFQADHGLYVDGRIGPITLTALNRAFADRQMELTSPVSIPQEGRLEIVSGPADRHGDGYNRVRLRSDVMVAYRQVYDEVRRQGGILTSSGGIRDLYANVNANRSATSFHYSGRALDLFVWSGMQDPQTDPYVVERLGDRRYRVYARCLAERALSGALPSKRKIDNVVTYRKRVGGISVSDHFLDLTALFDLHGFKPIRARRAFETGGSALGAEWWHFQWETGMIPHTTTFGSELLKLYSEAQLRSSPPWVYRDYIWKNNWF